MASSITASSSTSMVARISLVAAPRIISSPVLGLPTMAMKRQVRCSMEAKSSEQENTPIPAPASLATAATSIAAAAATWCPSALALVDERMSTEGTGLPFGLSNNLLGWLLAGVFGIIWSLYFVYTTTLEEDEESGLSL
ncbi:hypothetical protein Droror1_Dr00003830 [Drosera rotundifolia]